MNYTISVLLVDDHPLLRKCLQRALEDDPELSVVGTAANGAEAVKLAAEVAPHVVVMDLAMPVMDGIEATRRILSRAPHTAVLMLSMNSEQSSFQKAIEAGAKGYLVKNATNFNLADAVKAVAAGKQVLDPGFAEQPSVHDSEPIQSR